jgi:hypothetical protein
VIFPRLVTGILRRLLHSGEPVEIEGLGTLQLIGGKVGFTPEVAPQVFIGYVAEDLKDARRLAEALRGAGCSPWLDKDKLLPGQNWPRAIQRAIETSDVFVACFSQRSILKTGQFQSEVRYALDCARRRPLDDVFLIPVRLDPCAVPARIAEQVQYVDLYPDWERGIRRIIHAIRRATPLRARVSLR